MKRRSLSIRPRMRAATLGLSGMMLAASGCDGQVTVTAVCNDPNLLLFWAAIPCALGLVVAAPALYGIRKQQLDHWDLADAPRAPSAFSIVSWSCAAFGVILVLPFPFYLLLADACDPDQRIYNIGIWAVGSLLGMGIALVGLVLANWGYSKESA